jgi:hypothetical protein
MAAAAFSHRAPWNDEEPDAIPAGQTITFRAATGGVLEGCFLRVVTPSVRYDHALPSFFNWLNPFRASQWAFKLPIPRLHHVEESFTNFEAYIKGFIAHRRASMTDLRKADNGRTDLLGALCHASARDEEEGKAADKDGEKKTRLSDREVLGNMFGIMVAGHGGPCFSSSQVVGAFSLIPFHLFRLDGARARVHPTILGAVSGRAEEADRAH